MEDGVWKMEYGIWKMDRLKVISEVFFIFFVSVILASCLPSGSKSYSPEQKKYIAEINKFRKKKMIL